MKNSRFLRLSFIGTVLTCFLYALAAGEPSPVDSLAAKVDSLIAPKIKLGGPGCAVAAIRDGSIVFERGYGLANLDWAIPNTPTTVFNVASVSKQFTAACIVLLAEDGKLSLDDDIHSWLPEIKDYGYKITIRHLLHHTSGIRDYESLMVPAGMRYDLPYEPREIFDFILRQKALDFVPGEKHSYSNSGYILLREIVLRAAGLSLSQFAEERIFKPLGMNDTFYYDKLHRVVKNRATGYDFDLAELCYTTGHYDIYTVGPGGVYSTVEDLALWDHNFYENRIGGAHFLETMLAPGVLNNGDTLNYACGLETGSYRGLPTISHTGWWAGFLSHIVRFPKQKFTVILLANSTIDIGPAEYCRMIADIYLYDQFPPEKRPVTEKKAEPSVKPIEVAVNPAVYDRYIGRYKPDNMEVVFAVARDGGRLMGQFPGQRFQLFPESDSTFFLKVDEVRVKFPNEENSNASYLLMNWYRRGREIIFKRFEPHLTEEELRQYSGEYYSDELQITWRIAPKGNLLGIESTPRTIDLIGDDLLLPKKDGSFGFANMELRFGRDDEGQVTGFELTCQGGTWKVHFVRR